ncbi:PP2C family protein-serine/threonine phosphatase [Planktotalea sp.]|uniref:PP2C family protein-serine/threonine phosphatase n=1 Tax=Planktotalea sp. TaxID=2029877 RepID=UPI003D6B09EB
MQRTLMCLLIGKLGYEAIPAEDGEQALDLVQSTDAQILISDLHMPGLNGIELTQEVRKLNLDHYIHIIMITGRDDEEDRSKALEAGVDDFMSKGHNPTMLTARIRAATRLIHHEMELADRNRILKEAKDRIEDDLRAAASAQRSLLPQLEDQILGFRVSSAFVPSAIVSGDMFGCFALSDERLGFYAVDVSGHGVRASLLSVAIGHLITPDYFRNAITSEDGGNDLAAMVSALNKRFFSFESDEYFTMFCGVIDKTTGKLDFCQAGHPSPLFLGPKGTVQVIGDGGFPVGILNSAEFENESFQFDEGGLFIMCSDAAIEATNETERPFGLRRLQELVESNADSPACSMPKTIVSALTAWRGGVPLEDDLTVVSIERTIE